MSITWLAAGLRRLRTRPFPLSIVLPVAYIGILLICIAISAVGGWLPPAFTVRSAGSGFPAFNDGGNGILLVSFTLSAMAALLVGVPAYLLRNRPIDWPESLTSADYDRTRSVVIPLLLALSAGILAFHFATPPNLGGSNYRYLWVDILTGYNPHIQTVYFVPSVLKSIFRDFQSQFVALCVAVATYLFYDCCRLLRFHPIVSVLATVSFFASAHLLSFYSPSEDVTVLVAVSLLVANTMLRRSAVAFGLASAVFLLSRPHAAQVPASYFIGQMVVLAISNSPLWARGTRWRYIQSVLFDRFIVLSATICVMVTLAFHLYWIETGYHFLQNMPSVVPRPRPIDGFTIYDFSGAFLLHALWVFSPLAIVFTYLGINMREARDGDVRAMLVFSALIAFFLNALVFEAISEAGFYYNWRYLIYGFPGILLASWCFVDRLAGTNRIWAAMAGAALAVAIIFGSGPNVIKSYASMPIVRKEGQLVEQKDTLLKLIGERQIIGEKGQFDLGDFNWMAAVTYKYARSVTLEAETDYGDDIILTKEREDGYLGLHLITEIGGIQFFQEDPVSAEQREIVEAGARGVPTIQQLL